VGTPIGNLGDLTQRAAEALRSADLVLAEDTRMAARLLAHLGARTPTLSYNEHNAALRQPAILTRLAAGETLALTTDAGMPAVSDPGAALVRVARAAGARVEVVPGPSAVTAAVALAGIEASGFVFGGFLPSRPASARTRALRRLYLAAADCGLPLVLFEAPHRLHRVLAELEALAPAGSLVVARELTKRHEQVISGTAAQVGAQLAGARGECVVIAAAEERPGDGQGVVAGERASHGALEAGTVARAASSVGLSPRSVVELLRAAGVSRRSAYRLVAGEEGPASAAASANDRLTGL
jgi:16S rRNA (cytidine1402-2'-O)-methyltransferase